jgi:hypothetical protein
MIPLVDVIGKPVPEFFIEKEAYRGEASIPFHDDGLSVLDNANQWF